LSVATQSDADGHDTADSGLPASTDARLHAAAPPVGFAVVTALPASSTATQNVAETHRSPVIAFKSTFVDVQADAGPVGLVDVETFPLPSPTAHSAVEGQDTDVRPSFAVEENGSWWSTTTGRDQLNGEPAAQAAMDPSAPSSSTAAKSGIALAICATHRLRTKPVTPCPP